MYGQFSAKGVWPASQAFCTFDSSQVETAVGAMCALWIASYIIVSTALLAGVLMLLRFDAAICPPKLWKAVTAPSYLSPSKARPLLQLGVLLHGVCCGLEQALRGRRRSLDQVGAVVQPFSVDEPRDRVDTALVHARSHLTGEEGAGVRVELVQVGEPAWPRERHCPA